MHHSVEDRVLCYHGPKLYEAKIMQVKHDLGTDKYFVHYKGWKSKWDEWVDLDRIVEFNSEGLNLQKKLSIEHTSIELKGDEKEVENSKAEIPVLFKLGKNFKHFANYDWLQVNKNSKILNAPVSFSAADFLHQYAKFHLDSRKIDFIENFISFLDIFIGKNLLYRQERLHYLPLANLKGAASLYGPEILIRFFARLNIILQDYSLNIALSEFSHDLYKISDYLMKTLSKKDFDSAYIIRSDHYESYYSIN